MRDYLGTGVAVVGALPDLEVAAMGTLPGRWCGSGARVAVSLRGVECLAPWEQGPRNDLETCATAECRRSRGGQSSSSTPSPGNIHHTDKTANSNLTDFETVLINC